MIYETYDGQIDLFESPLLKVTKPIRLIELFAGVGAQAKALERLGVPFEHWRVCEFEKNAIASYNAVHGTNFEVSDIRDLHGSDLGIEDKEHFTYLLTYSFPCQDLSVAGKQAGMNRGGQTRSGLLWEVERLLNECDELPDILLMENVKNIIGERHKTIFNKWRESLVEMGYTNRYQVLNAKDYGVPQNRERCFMVSWLGDYSYQFPEPIELRRVLKDVLEEDVDDKYYLTEEQINSFVYTSNSHKDKGNGFLFEPLTHTRTITTRYRGTTDNYIEVGEN